jgi:hypothetical protein
VKLITCLSLVLAIAFGGLSGCKSKSKLEKQREAALKKKAKAELRDESTDVDFQAFVTRLRKAVATRDLNTLASMMTTNFGYRINPDAEGEGVFKYWDEQNLWPELEGILSEKSDKSLNYDGYRAGIRRINGSWKFTYFVNGP